MPPLGAARRIRALIAFGYAPTYLRRRLGVSRTIMRQLTGRPLRAATHDDVTAIPADLHCRIARLFAELQLHPGPSDTARALGRQHGWALPLMWDEDRLDDPEAEPVDCRRTPGRACRDRTAELREQVGLQSRPGATARQIAARLGVSERTVARIRAEARDERAAGAAAMSEAS
uniref:helix-turn-helix domain-containing protein n=1 Tax=Nocardia suismassiliense TaxID=2077092 RepID=UPI003F49ACFE